MLQMKNIFKRWKIQEINHELVNFIKNKCYWSRHNTHIDNYENIHNIQGKMTG